MGVRAKVGSAEATTSFSELEDLYDAVFARLVTELTVVAGSRTVAEDAVQEAFVRATLKWNRIQRYDDPRAWVRRVAHNVINDHHRRRKREVLSVSPADGVADATDPGGLTESPLADALAKLSLQHRQVLVLQVVCDLSIAEIAATLDIRQGAVKSRLHRARRELADSLQKGSSHDQQYR